jgi:hypothetical protein
MTEYEFMNTKDDFIKMSSHELSINVIAKAFNAIETKNDKVSQILISPKLFEKLKEEIIKDKFEGKKLYKTITNENKIFNAPIIIDNQQDINIITFFGTKSNQINKLKLFLITKSNSEY